MLLFVGRIEALKGLDTLLRAMALSPSGARSGCPTCACRSSAARPSADAEMRNLLELRRQLELGSLVTFLGARDQDTLHYYYTAADAVIMPSHYESFGMVALEAMACGTPVIASEVGGLAFLVKHGQTGFHVPDRDPQLRAERVINVLDDPALRARLGVHAREHARQYAWPVIADQILDVFAEAITQAHPARQIPLQLGGAALH
jgi:D-inositol-3-phosphate glycosyltransferase